MATTGSRTGSRGRNATNDGGPVASSWRTPAFRALNQPLGAVLGGPTAKALASLNLRTVGDLMAHLPRRYLSGTETSDLSTLRAGEDVAVVASVRELKRIEGGGGLRRTKNGRRVRWDRLELRLGDQRGNPLDVAFFGQERHVKYWQAQLSLGVKGIFVGKLGEFAGRLQMSHPNFVMLDAQGRIVGYADPEKRSMAQHVSRSGLVGLYPATSKFPTWQVGECADLVLEGLAGLPDPMPAALRERLDLPELLAAYTSVHRPGSLDEAWRAVDRLKFDEALALQLTMAYRRADAAQSTAAPVERRDDGILTAFDQQLPFELTAGQQEVADQIFADLAVSRPMQRLLQGEVGSGKTVVALRAMLAVVDSGRQAVLMAPTEVLAFQHYDSVRAMLGELGTGRMLGSAEHATDVVLLTGSLSAAQRRDALAKIADGRAGIVVGTHALLSDTVEFAALGMVVVDEQHRFGVEQRAALQRRSELVPHLLVLTATPIPRSIAMTVFGDLEISTLREIPAGRQAVQTTVVDVANRPGWLERAWQRVVEEVASGRQVFVVCPRIDQSEPDATADGLPASASVQDVAEQLRAGPLAGVRLGVLHGRLPSAEKDATMAAFTAGELDVLVATTVIEVGVDVPNASMMVIMDADRFGISQLHQLRGRIGRGEHPGICLLVTSVQPATPAGQRLSAVAATRDGFELAEVDLEQRREGDVLGASQSGGRSTLRLLRVLADAELISLARGVAAELVAADPRCSGDWTADLVRLTESAGEWMDLG